MVARPSTTASSRPRETSVLRRWLRPAMLALLVLPVAPVARAAEALTPMPDFQLADVNPNSPRYGRTVSPRDYRLQISAYYFSDAG